MAHSDCQRHTRIRNQTQILNPWATLYYTEHVYIAQTPTQIPTTCFCVGHKSESVSGNVNEPKERVTIKQRFVGCWPAHTHFILVHSIVTFTSFKLDT